MGDSDAMVAEGYTTAPYGDYNASAATVESTGQENAVPVNQSNNASLVNGTGPESGLTAPAENGNATDSVAVAAPAAEHGDNPGKFFFFFLIACMSILVLCLFLLCCFRLNSFT